MRWLTLAVLSSLLLVPLTGAQGANDPEIRDFRVQVGGEDVSSVDLHLDRGKTVVFQADLSDAADQGGSILVAEVQLAGLTLRMRQVSVGTDFETWEVALPVDDPDLLTGTYPVSLNVFDRNGGRTSCTAAVVAACPDGEGIPSFAVTLQNPGSLVPTIDLVGVEKVNGAYPEQEIGTTDTVLVLATIKEGDLRADHLVNKVTYRNTDSALPETRAAPPYRLGAAHFPEGESTIEVKLYDRAGRTTSLSFPAYVDITRPEVALVLPSATFTGVPFQLRLDIEDAGPVQADVTFGNKTLSASGDEIAPFEFTSHEVGTHTILTRVEDRTGNVYQSTTTINTTRPTTDSTIRVEVTPSHPIPEEKVVVRFTAQQQSGVAELPFNVTFTVTGLGQVCCDAPIDVPLNTPFESTFNRTYLPGQYAYNATIHPFDGVNETDDGDQTDLGFFEVFMGKVLYNDDVYYVRLTEGGIEPSHAVSPGGSLYDMTAEVLGSRTVYAFTAKGTDLYWDPLQRITDLTPADEPDDEESPGAPLVVLLALLAVAGIAARRRM